MNTDFRIKVGYFQHPKIKKLRRRLGADGVLAHIHLLEFAALSKPDGVLTNMGAEDIALAGDYGGDCDFAETLIDLHLLDERDGVFEIHDWVEHNPWAAGSPQRSAAASTAANARWSKKRVAPFGHTEPTEPQCETMRTASRPASKSNAESCYPECPSPSPTPFPTPTPSPNPSPNPTPETLGEGVRVDPPARAKQAPNLGDLMGGEERMPEQACPPRSPATLQPASKGSLVVDYGPPSPATLQPASKGSLVVDHGPPSPATLQPSSKGSLVVDHGPPSPATLQPPSKGSLVVDHPPTSGSPTPASAPRSIDPAEPLATQVPPTRELVRLHFAGLGETQAQADEFYCHYGGNGWKMGQASVVNWVMTVESWRKKRSKFDSQPLRPSSGGPEPEPLRPNNGGPESRSPRVTPRSAAQGGTLDEQLEYMRQMHARLHRKRD